MNQKIQYLIHLIIILSDLDQLPRSESCSKYILNMGHSSHKFSNMNFIKGMGITTNWYFHFSLLLLFLFLKIHFSGACDTISPVSQVTKLQFQNPIY